MKSSSVFVIAGMLLLTAACRNDKIKNDSTFIIGPASGINGLHAPWDGLDDRTEVRFFADSSDVNILYDVVDSTITLSKDFHEEKDVEPEDRVEVFFSPGADMEIYYCAEIDPEGRVLDYSCRYPSQMDYGWDFSTLKVMSAPAAGGYSVLVRVSKDELSSLGIDLERGFYMGIFRADFRPDGSVNWYSYVETDDESPNFHKPDMLFFTKLN